MADRRGADDLLVHALSCGQTLEQAAASAGVSARTARRRTKEAGFMRRVRKARAELVGNAAGRLAANMGAASDTLAALLSDDDPNVRLKAADKIIGHAMKAAELIDLEARVSQLEGDHDDDTEGADDGD